MERVEISTRISPVKPKPRASLLAIFMFLKFIVREIRRLSKCPWLG
jgi:hypothetical protein